MWPKASHAFFMHPPLLKSTGGRTKNRIRSAAEGGSKKKSKKHECPICHELGHHWYTCKSGNPEDIAALEAERGPPKKRQKKAARCNTKTSIVPLINATPSQMVFPHNEAVANATHKKRKRSSGAKNNKRSASSSGAKNSKRSASSSGATTSSYTHVSTSNRSITGSNDPVPLQVLPVPVHEDLATTANGPVHSEPGLQVSPRKKMAIKKKLTPRKKLQIAPANTTSPDSPASNTRSKKLNM